MTKKTLVFWIIVDALHACSGAAATILALILRKMDDSTKTGPHFLRSLVISKQTLNGVLILGIVVLASWLLSVLGIFSGLQKGERPNTRTLMFFNWSLIMSSMVTLVVGSAIWFLTLKPRLEFSRVWLVQSTDKQQFLQDTLQCCGYFNATTAGLWSVQNGFCAQLVTRTNTTLVPGCVGPIGDAADFNLNNLFSGIFGFAAVQSSLFILTCAIINWRNEVRRVARINIKRGFGGHFS